MIRAHLSDSELAAELQHRFNFQDYEFDNELLAIQYRYDELISRKVKYYLNFVLDPTERIEWISHRFIKMFGSERSASDALYMNAEDFHTLGKQHLLGTHAHAHRPLAVLSEGQMKQEIAQSLDILENLSSKRPIGISYPFGGKSAVSTTVFMAAEELGLRYGFTMERGINVESDNSSMALKRIDMNDIKKWVDVVPL
jgi:peptidoglycan/xylan/chitin deacetylase (PgdA/CDA1 family)